MASLGIGLYVWPGCQFIAAQFQIHSSPFFFFFMLYGTGAGTCRYFPLIAGAMLGFLPTEGSGGLWLWPDGFGC